jgi:general secretion pathway protein B
MSYILEALKKAQAERELGRVPPLQGSASALVKEVDPGLGAGVPRWVWPGALLVVVLAVAGAAAWWIGRPALAPAAAPAASIAPLPASAAVSPPPVAPAPAPAQAQPKALPPELPPVAPPLPVARPAAPPPPPSIVATASPSEEVVVAFEALDAATRSRLPPLVAGGTIHSSERAQRMVILDGQVLREGDSLTADVSVLTIEPRGVVLHLGAAFGNRRVRLRP